MKKPFDNIKVTHLHTLCNILANTQIRHVSNIKRRYLENALAFDDTLSLLEDLKIVKNISEELFSIKTFSTNDSLNDFKNKLLPILFSSNEKVLEQLRSFLRNFKIDTNNIFFKATEIQKIKFSSTRNFLLELGFINAAENNTIYFVNPNYKKLFIELFIRNKLSPEMLKKKQVENDLIGLRAEKAILNFEINRLSGFVLHPSEIKHTAL